ncbi:phage shock protein C [Streptococcus macacae NCTC 11558]|uniref:PspC domain protein n=2 Tax=Streptococcus macacae TaxID=1339 RepID=G5JYM2_9STRE|nr:PspC domain protein [Streptococcus macacae NCTC 11558]SUN78135.1 phage shock protein C [Streptococcus macacae NCTC 11558]
MASGVIAGLADKYDWELPIARVLAALFMYIFPGGIVLYIILAVCLPYKEDLDREDYQAHYHSQGSRKRKDAEIISDEEDNWF